MAPRPVAPAGPSWTRRHPWLTTAGMAALYAVAALAGRATRLPESPLALVWPAAAVGFVWIGLAWGSPQRVRVDLIALAATTVLVNGLTGASWRLCLLFAVANVVQAVVACWTLSRLGPQAWRLRTPADLTVLIVACTGGALVSGVLGAAGLWAITGAEPLSAAGGWILRNSTSTFVFSALALRLVGGAPRARLAPARWLELAVSGTVLATAYAAVFAFPRTLPLVFLLVPLSMWLALRFGATVAAAHVLAVGIFVVLETLAGNGPLAVSDTSTQALLSQSYVAITALVSLSLALLRENRDALVAGLQDAHRRAAAQATTLSTFLDTVDVGVVACDADGHLTLFNRATRDFHGMPEDPDLDPADWADRYHLLDEDGRRLDREQVPLHRALVEGSVSNETMVIAADGHEHRVVRCDGRRLVDADGRTLGAVVAMKDVTAARHAKRALEEREQRFRAAFHDSPTSIAYVGLDGHVQDVNAALRRFLGVSSARLRGMPLRELVHLEDHDALREASLGDGTGTLPVEVRMRRADGTYLWCQLATTRSSYLDGRPYLLVQLLDVHARKQHEQALERAARRDPLTGLGNRNALDARLLRMLAGASGVDGPGVVVLFIDLDGFKAVNDTFGHEVGDVLLVEVATRLQSAVRPEDFVARMGGDEFVIVCPEPAGDGAGREFSTVLVQRLESALGAPIVHDGRVLQVGASIGAVSAPRGATPQDVLDDADRAMYRRKKQRRDGEAVPAAGVPAPRTGDADLDLSVATALADGRLHLLYQPVYDLRTGSCVGAEALLRLTDLDGSLVPPDRFIPVAEVRGHIGEIGRWVLTEALTRAAQWKRDLPDDQPFLIGVNVSTLQLHDPGLVAHVAERLAATGLDPGSVGLEITESRLLPDIPEVQQVLGELHGLGVRVTIDDFGTGFANLGYLGTFPFDAIKIDRRYVQHLTDDGAQGRLAAGVFALARSTGMVMVAEGLETEQERSAVLATGCHLAQGFLMSEPLIERDLLAVLRSGGRLASRG